MFKTVSMVSLMLVMSLEAAFAQENAVEHTLPTTSGMSIIAWVFMAIIIAAGIIWTMRSRRGRNR